MISDEIKERIQKIRFVIVDNDGVMTDARIVYGDYGDELKFFDVRDGFGLVMLRRAGYQTAMLSARKSRINRRRAKEVGFSQVYQNAFDKLSVFEKALKKTKVSAEETCYIGDDLIDIPPMKRVGFAVAVADAVAEVREIAHYTTECRGGRGAVREVTDLLLKTQGQWADVTQRYFR